MCGRFSQYWSVDEWNRVWPADWRVRDVAARYNVAPGTAILALVHRVDAGMVGGPIMWGIKTSRGMVINARCESMTVRPMFRALLSYHRLIIPMNGYYEWQRRTQQPYYLYNVGGEPLWALGLYQPTSEGARAVILTRAALPPIAAIHERMPLLADQASAAQWLQCDAPQYLELVRQLSAQTPQLQCHAVSKQVNGARHEGPLLIQALPSQYVRKMAPTH